MLIHKCLPVRFHKMKGLYWYLKTLWPNFTNFPNSPHNNINSNCTIMDNATVRHGILNNKRKVYAVIFTLATNLFWTNYRNDPKFSDRYSWANSVDPDQTAPRGAVWSGSTLFAIPSVLFGLITLWQSHIVHILEWLQQIFWVSEYLGNLR